MSDREYADFCEFVNATMDELIDRLDGDGSPLAYQRPSYSEIRPYRITFQEMNFPAYSDKTLELDFKENVVIIRTKWPSRIANAIIETEKSMSYADPDSFSVDKLIETLDEFSGVVNPLYWAKKNGKEVPAMSRQFLKEIIGPEFEIYDLPESISHDELMETFKTIEKYRSTTACMIADVINAETREYVGVFIIDKDGKLIMKIPRYEEVVYDIADPTFSPGSVKIEMIRIRNMRQFEREGPPIP